MKLFCRIYLFVIVFITIITGDPQDDAEIACGDNQPFILTELSESLGFPDSYPNNDECTWEIAPPEVPDGHELYLTVEYFSTIADLLKIYNDKGRIFIVLDDNVAMDVLTINSKSALLYFNSLGNIVGVGFRIHYEFADESPVQNLTQLACDPDTMPYTMTLQDGLIESLHYPNMYSPLLCQWHINVPVEKAPFGLYVSAIEYFTSDVLSMYAGAHSSGQLIGQWIGSDTGKTLNFTGSEVFLEIDPEDYNPAAHGFQLAYYPVDPACLTDEGAEIQIPDDGDHFGTVRSPGFPYIVPEHSRCRWTIIAPSGKSLILSSTVIHIHESVDCEDEYLEIVEGGADDGISLGRYCGNTTFGSIPSPSGTMQLKLKTEDHPDDIPVAIGFSVDYETA